MCFKPASQIQGDYVYIQALACLLESALIGWPSSNEVVLLLQLRYAKVGGGVGQEDVTSAQYVHPGRCGEGEFRRYRRTLEKQPLANDGRRKWAYQNENDKGKSK